ncbi:MAG: hypothetical protein COV44_03850 [Deltaproteobacteria bacterium CG11_big_fil_rev_8_21_14_0_20_45_16]|nr:MAG: hypothetical protein COV44_03850 [Deltaproteobacteria bacterium CG11_big_fil_rev_8_21_14_0_20_45_16]PIS10115.1 MAG: hypothetical protein COT73_11090 [Bdellovibrio sp. CG10_big_fil_rev_8_21_14_0_10_47_8]
MSHHAMGLKQFRMSLLAWISLLVLVAVGAIALYLTSLEDPTRAWFDYLIGSTMFLGFGLCGLFFVLINHLVSAKWSVALRRVFEGMSLTLPVAAILMFGVYLGVHNLYEWSHEAVVASDPLLQEKSGYLNPTFFGIRLAAYFLIWIFSALFLAKNSFAQDKTGDVGLSKINYKGSAFLMVLFAFSSCGAGFDLIMSLEPHWFSTIFGIYFFAGFFQSGMALMYIVAAYLWKKGILTDYLNKTHFHDLGKFVFAFSVFWAYIGFSQYMLYWYGNLPEETFWYSVRMEGGWGCMGLALLAVRWALPFLVLMPYGNKMNFRIAVPVCFVVIFGQWLDLFWNAMPAMRLVGHETGESVHTALIQWQDLAIGIGFVALFFLTLGMIYERIRMVPLRDPRLEDSIHHH